MTILTVQSSTESVQYYSTPYYCNVQAILLVSPGLPCIIPDLLQVLWVRVRQVLWLYQCQSELPPGPPYI